MTIPWKTRFRDIVLLQLGMLAACTGIASAFPRGHDGNYPLPRPQLKEFREKNKANIARLISGMSLNEVDAIMGREQNIQTYILQKKEDPLSNPHRQEAVSREGKDYLVLFYYTDLLHMDGKITDDELTPVVLQAGKILCVGWESCKQWPQVLPPPDTPGKNDLKSN